MKNLVICGDSFTIGIGCRDLENEPFGALLSKQLNLNQINLGKGSSSNLSIYLQAKYVVENIKDIEFCVLSVTSYNRTEWVKEPDKRPIQNELTNNDINYHQYPPYGKGTYMTDPGVECRIPYEFLDEKYNGSIFTENYHGIFDYVDTFLDKNTGSGYYARFENERPERARVLKQYYLDIYDERLKRINDMGVITMAHTLLKNNNIKHLILTPDHDFNSFSKFISPEANTRMDWGRLSLKFPDDLPSLHTSLEGHIEAAELVTKKFIENNWIDTSNNILTKKLTENDWTNRVHKTML
jgi:hypothetical protein